MEVYRIEGPGRYKTMTLPTHEFIRRFLIHVLPKGLHRIRHYGLFANGKHRAANICPPTARRAAKHSAEEYRSRRRIRSTSRSANAVPMLRWPLDHHRDLRARLSAQAHSGNDQDRYLMTPSPLTHDCPHTNRSRRHSTANVHPRARPPILSALTPQTSPQRAAGPPIAVLTARTIAPTAAIQTH
jgi:hypothetical protein